MGIAIYVEPVTKRFGSGIIITIMIIYVKLYKRGILYRLSVFVLCHYRFIINFTIFNGNERWVQITKDIPIV